MTAEELIGAIENMTVLELAELVKALQEKFGVSAAAPVAAAAPAPVVDPAPTAPTEPSSEVPNELISAKADSLKGLTVLGKIELPADRNKKKGGPVASSDARDRDKKRPRKRIDSKPGTPGAPGAPQAGQNRPRDSPTGPYPCRCNRPSTAGRHRRETGRNAGR